MCAICVNFEKSKMTREEIISAFFEIAIDADEKELEHLTEIIETLYD